MRIPAFLKTRKNLFIAILFAFVLVLFPTHPARACVLGWDPISGCVLEGVSYFVYLILTVVGNGIAVLAGLLQKIINLSVYPSGGIAVIDESWKIMRSFANMFFIAALIVMAFATIFDVLPGVAKYNARALFGRFILTALLINFSLVLGVMVIQGAQVLSNTFLTSIGDMSGRLGQNLNPALLIKGLPATAAQTIDHTIASSLISLVFALVLAVTFLFSLLTAAIFAFIRIPILWALLVVSPIAWIMNIFPGGEGRFQQWWKLFIGWNIFLPIFLFFLYFGLYFLNSQAAVMTAIANQVKNQKLGEGIPFDFQMLFMYIMAEVFLIGGTIVAMKASMFSGTGVVQVAGWSRGVVARRLGLAGAWQATKEKTAEIEAGEGRLGRIFGGPPTGLEAGRRLLGVQGGNLKIQQEFLDRTSKEFGNLDAKYRLGQLSIPEISRVAQSGSATNPRIYAYRKMLAKIGQLDNDIFISTLTQLSKNPLAAEDFTKTAGASKFSKMKGSDLAKMAAAESGPGYDYTSLKSNVAARREMFRYVQTDKKAASGLNRGQFDAGLSVFGGHTTADGRAFLKEMAKVSPDFAMSYNLDHKELKTEIEEGFEKAYGTKPANDFQLKVHTLGGSLKSGDIKDTAGINVRVWKEEGTPEEKETAVAFKESLKLYVAQLKGKARESYVNRLERALLDTFGGDKKIEILYKDILGKPTYKNAVRGRVPPTARTPELGT